MARDLQLSDPNGSCVVYLAKFLAADLENLVLTGTRWTARMSVFGICLNMFINVYKHIHES